jgi:phosphatidate phosphatase APP1
MRHSLVLLIVLAVVSLSSATDANVFEGTEETMRVFGTYAATSPDGDTLIVPIHVWVHEPERDTLRKLAIEAFADGLDVEEGTAAYDVLRRRMFDFMVDNESGVEVFATLEGDGLEPKEYLVGETPGHGHVDTVLRVPYTASNTKKVELTIRVEDADVEPQKLAIPVVSKSGTSVISDIDDTIKITNVVDTKELLANTFTREFRAAPGMAKLYRSWASDGAQFHYVSASPWNLQAELDRFAAEAGFPPGTYHLRIFRPKDIERTVRFLRSSQQHKLSSIRELLRHFPDREFILVGDTGESDPEIYARIARQFPKRVKKIYLRRVDGADNEASRFTKTFEGISDAKWTVFDDPEKL